MLCANSLSLSAAQLSRDESACGQAHLGHPRNTLLWHFGALLHKLAEYTRRKHAAAARAK